MLNRTHIALVAALVAPTALAEIEAKKSVEVYSEATNKSDVLETLKEGESLPSVERKGMFWQVKTKSGKDGYVSVLSVKHKPDSNADLAKAIKGVVKEGREDDGSTEGRARSAVMGVRGLREDASAGDAGQARPDLRAVFSMEDHVVSDKKLEALGEDVFKEIERKATED
jgi:hypothetical protein